MAWTSQPKRDLQAMKLKQEDRDVYKEKMELAIVEYKLINEDPASKVTLQSVWGAKLGGVPTVKRGVHESEFEDEDQ